MKSLREHPQVQLYLKKASKNIRKSQIKADIQEELLCHIESDVEYLQKNQGLDFESAVNQAISQLGPADGVDKCFFEVYHHSWRTFLKVVLGGVVLAGLFVLHFITNAFSEVEKKQKNYVSSIAPYVNEYISDLDVLDSAQIFARNPGNKDAGEFLNDRLNWAVSEENSHVISLRRKQIPKLANPFASVGSIGETDLAYRFRSEIGHTFSLENLTKFERQALDNADFSWMKELTKYDYWDLYKTGPFSNASQSEITTWNGSYSETPKPMFGMTLLAGLRLVRGLKDGQPQNALSEVHQLAKLLMTTETAEGLQSAIVIFNLARNFYLQQLKQGRIRTDDYKPVPEDVLFRASRVIDATQVFMSYNFARKTDVFRKIFGRQHLPLAACAGFMKATNLARMKRNTWFTLDDVADPEYGNNHRELLSRLKQDCRLTYFRENLTASEWALNLRKVEMPKHDIVEDFKIQNWGIWTYWYTMKYALEIPFLRNAYTRMLASESFPYFPVEYKEWNKYAKNLPTDKTQ